MNFVNVNCYTKEDYSFNKISIKKLEERKLK